MATKSEDILNSIQLKVTSIPENVAIARVTVAAFASQLDLTINELEEIKVATSEAVSNSIIHGYENNKNGIITITATLYKNKIEIIVEDEGRGIENIEKAMQPAFSSNSERMGLGFVFMKTFMDDVQVESHLSKGTKVFLSKKFSEKGLFSKKDIKAVND